MNRPFLFRVAVQIVTSAVAVACTMPILHGSQGEQRPWTVLIYGAADNNADGPIFGFLEDVQKSYDSEGMQVVVFLDRSEEFSHAAVGGEDFHDSRLFVLDGEEVVRVGGGDAFPEITTTSTFEADSGAPETLRKFIAFGKETYPAEHYALIIYGHADGRAMCPDDKSKSEMGIAALSDFLTEDEAVDFTALELCSMGGVEIAYQWRPGNGGFFTEALVAIPNAGPPMDWARIMRRIRTPGDGGNENTLDPSTMTAAEFACLAVEEGGAGRSEFAKKHPLEQSHWQWEAVSAYDLWVVDEVKASADELAVALVATDGKEAFEKLRGSDEDTEAMNYSPGETAQMPYFDLYDLASRAAVCEELEDTVKDSAEGLKAAVDEMVLASFGMNGYQGFEPGHHGVYIVFPEGDAKESGSPATNRRWERHCWYTPIAPPRGVRTYGRWAWCSDGAEAGNQVVENWFEMLDHWYDDPKAGRGGVNEYEW